MSIFYGSTKQRGNPGGDGGALFGGGDPTVIGAPVGPEIDGRTVRETQTGDGSLGVTVRLEQVGGLADNVLDRGRHGEGLDTGNVLDSSDSGHQNYLIFRFLLIGVGFLGGLSVFP